MPAITLHLASPADDTRLIGGAPVRLTAVLDQLAPVPLFFKWYSSAAADPLGTALDLPGVVLPMGSQVITFSARDQADDSLSSMRAVVHAGLAGGPVAGGQPCRVHVLRARIFEPAPPPALTPTLSRTAATLVCEAPVRWARKLPPATVYELDPDHRALNRLRFVWRFTPEGAPAGRTAKDLSPTAAEWAYLPPDSGRPARLRYSGALPADLDSGRYTLTLRVEHADTPTTGHEHRFAVVLS